MARRKAQTCGVRASFRETRRAPFGAPHALKQRKLAPEAHAICGNLRRRAALSPQVSRAGPELPSGFAPARLVWTLRSSASSWQDLLVGPGGAPAPPECLACVTRPAGAAPRPAIKTPLERAPQRTRCCELNRAWQGGDKFHKTNLSSPGSTGRSSKPRRALSRRSVVTGFPLSRE